MKTALKSSVREHLMDIHEAAIELHRALAALIKMSHDVGGFDARIFFDHADLLTSIATQAGCPAQFLIGFSKDIIAHGRRIRGDEWAKAVMVSAQHMDAELDAAGNPAGDDAIAAAKVIAAREVAGG